VEEALGLVDDFVGNLVLGIQDRNLTDIVNVVVVSDHGEHRAFVSCREAAVS
jgi:predicted AlkP superfamily pyrophosphatase or phosphodiesterase